MKFFFFIVTFFVISFQSEKADAIDIQCEFKTLDWGYGNKKGCTVQSVTLSSPADREITSVNGDQGKTYNDVLWFYSSSKTFIKFPENIKKIFPNVEVVHIDNANIAILTKSDMASLGSQLRKFSFYGNEIEVLEEGLFDENPNLDFIYLDHNKIKFVASGVFDKLPKLRTLWFLGNPCHSGDADNDRASVLNMISQIKGKCQNVQTTSTTEKSKTEHELRIEELTAELAELKRSQSGSDKQHEDELQKHQEELQKLNEKFEAEALLKDENIKVLEEHNEDLKKELAAMKPCVELHEVRDSLMSKLKEMEAKFEGKLDTTRDMIKTTDAKLDSTLVKPMRSLHDKMDTMDLKLDSSDQKFEFLNATCIGLDYNLHLLECIRIP